MIDHGQVRNSDPMTSREAAKLVRPGSARHALLMAHASHPDGLTDEEAALIARLPLTSEYATRCSELMRAGLLVDTPMARASSVGTRRMVRRITLYGISVPRSGQDTARGEKTPSAGPGLATPAPTGAPIFGDIEALRAMRRPRR